MHLRLGTVLASPLRLLLPHRMRPMPTDPPPSLQPIVRELARYLIAHPQASDTPEGIARWWLGESVADPASLQQALDWMKARSLLEELTAADGRRRYRRRGEDAALRAAAEDWPA
jgi:hypothetical protein